MFTFEQRLSYKVAVFKDNEFIGYIQKIPDEDIWNFISEKKPIGIREMWRQFNAWRLTPTCLPSEQQTKP